MICSKATRDDKFQDANYQLPTTNYMLHVSHGPKWTTIFLVTSFPFFLVIPPLGGIQPMNFNFEFKIVIIDWIPASAGVTQEREDEIGLKPALSNSIKTNSRPKSHGAVFVIEGLYLCSR